MKKLLITALALGISSTAFAGKANDDLDNFFTTAKVNSGDSMQLASSSQRTGSQPEVGSSSVSIDIFPDSNH